VGLAGVVGGAGLGLAVVGGVEGGVNRGVGNDGSVGPAPGMATGLPSMMLLHPESETAPASNSDETPARPRRAFCDNRTRYSPKI
jgi:hypothetical protein